jgi:hypothetical protein
VVHIEGEIVVDRPVGEVFDFVADERNEPGYDPHLVRTEQTSDRPIGLPSPAQRLAFAPRGHARSGVLSRTEAGSCVRSARGR